MPEQMPPPSFGQPLPRPPVGSKYTKPLVIIAVLVVLAVVGLWFSRRTAKAPSPAGSGQAAGQPATQLPPVPKITVAVTAPGQLPANFPAGLPLEKGAQVTQNQSAANSLTGKTDASYIYITKLAIDKNYSAYNKYFSQGGWKVVSTQQGKDFEAITATKDSATFNVVLDYKSAAPQDKVMLDYVY